MSRTSSFEWDVHSAIELDPNSSVESPDETKWGTRPLPCLSLLVISTGDKASGRREDRSSRTGRQQREISTSSSSNRKVSERWTSVIRSSFTSGVLTATWQGERRGKGQWVRISQWPRRRLSSIDEQQHSFVGQRRRSNIALALLTRPTQWTNEMVETSIHSDPSFPPPVASEECISAERSDSSSSPSSICPLESLLHPVRLFPDGASSPAATPSSPPLAVEQHRSFVIGHFIGKCLVVASLLRKCSMG